MTSNEINAAIAASEKWTNIRPAPEMPSVLLGDPPDDDRPDILTLHFDENTYCIPDYARDEREMLRLERGFDWPFLTAYIDALWAEVGNPEGSMRGRSDQEVALLMHKVHCATALQRATSYCRARNLKGGVA